MKNQKHQFDKLIAHGQALALAHGHRWTTNRTLVYSALLAATKPITAYAILDVVSTTTHTAMKPASIYRALESLCQLELVVKIESLNAYAACQHPHEKHQHVFLVCDDCGNTQEMAGHNIAKRLSTDAQTHGFSAKRQVLELHGACQNCQ